MLCLISAEGVESSCPSCVTNVLRCPVGVGPGLGPALGRALCKLQLQLHKLLFAKVKQDVQQVISPYTQQSTEHSSRLVVLDRLVAMLTLATVPPIDVSDRHHQQ